MRSRFKSVMDSNIYDANFDLQWYKLIRRAVKNLVFLWSGLSEGNTGG